jgi:2-polyprenyl-3-methyl-5-hydroxy-6-metoxy-1,4-benzoquinol methylase
MEKNKLKKLYIKQVEKYLYKKAKEKCQQENIEIDSIHNIKSIKNHIIDLNEKHTTNIDVNNWYENDKNQYRLYSSIYRYKATKEIVNKYVSLKDLDVVDFGAGNGVFLEYLNLSGTGVDINQQCVKRMKSIGINAYELSELNDSFKNKFLNAFAFEVIEHVENQLMVLNNIYSYIQKGGYCFVSIPYVKNSHIIKKVGESQATKRIENYHISELDTNDFKNLITHSKFNLVNIIHINPHKISSNIIGKLFDKLYRADKPKWSIFVLKKEEI